MEARYAVQLGEVAQARGKALQSLTERHRAEEAEEDLALQQREAERERGRQEVEARLAEWKRSLKAAAAREKAHGKGTPPPPPEPPVNKWTPGKKAPRRTKRTNARRPPARPQDDPRPPEPLA